MSSFVFRIFFVDKCLNEQLKNGCPETELKHKRAKKKLCGCKATVVEWTISRSGVVANVELCISYFLSGQMPERTEK